MKRAWKALLYRIHCRSGSDITASSKPLSQGWERRGYTVRNVRRSLPVKTYWNILLPCESFLCYIAIEILPILGPQSVDLLLLQGFSERDGNSS